MLNRRRAARAPKEKRAEVFFGAFDSIVIEKSD